MPTIDPQLAITDATRRLDLAQTELGNAIAELTVSDRADKRMITERLRLAFDEIVAAKAALAVLIDARPDTDTDTDDA